MVERRLIACPGRAPAAVKAAVGVGAALAVALLAGCGSLHLAPYNGRESCDGVGGTYTADGRCVGGSASLPAASTARSAAEPPLRYWPRVYIESAPVTLSRNVDAPAGSGTQK